VRVDLGRWARPAEWTVAVLAASLFALTYGFHFGISNQIVYLLPSKAVVDPELYTRDWFVAETTHYHVAFRYAGALLLAADARGWAVALANTVLVAGGMTFVFYLVRQLVPRALSLPAFLGVVALALVTRTDGPAVTNAFGTYLQPSSFGAVGFFAAVAFLAAGRFAAAGAAMAISGLFHMNFLLLELGAFSIAHLLLGRRDFVRRGVCLLVPGIVVLLLLAPVILKSAGSGKEAEIAQTYYVTVRSPHHFQLKSFESRLLLSLAWMLLGYGFAARVLAPRPGARRLAGVTAGLAIVIGAGILFSSRWYVRSAHMLFAWRMVPHLELCLQALFMAALAQAAASPARSLRAGPAALGSFVAGVVAVTMAGAIHAAPEPAKVLLWATAAAAIALAATRAAPIADRWVRGRASRLAPWFAPLLLGLGAATLVVSDARTRIDAATQGPDLLRLGASPEIQRLCAWVRRETPKTAAFLAPPDEEMFRFHCERATVVDWKAVPLVPRELAAWLERLKDVTGTKMTGGRKDLAGYQSMDAARLRALRDEYGVDYALFRGRRSLPGLTPVYQSARYSVFELRDLAEGGSAATPSSAPEPEPAGDAGSPDEAP
jgi:hypothetical protein